MTYVITQHCCNDASCVPVCPVNCIHPAPGEPEYLTTEMLYIDPDTCIDCGACVTECPVNAIAQIDELEPRHELFAEINARWFLDPAHQGYSIEQAASRVPRFSGPGGGPLRVAVVGSGPAGCYAVEELVTRRGLDAEVSVFERLPVPGGLVRYGVAPDHQATKAVGEVFARTLRRSGVELYLGVEVGHDISHDQLMACHHAVIYAVGAPGDRTLGIHGEHLPGSHAATEFVAWYNGHPDFAGRVFDLSGDRAVIVGNGNVAIDVARILTADIGRLRGTDIAAHALEQLAASRIQEVVVLGRRGPAQASFTIAELTGLTSTPDVDVLARPDELELDPVTGGLHAGHEHAMDLYKVELLRRLPSSGTADRRRIELRFLASPVEILGPDRVTGVKVARTHLVHQSGTALARATGQSEVLDCGLVLRSVGYRGHKINGVPFDSARGVLPNHDGRVVDADLEMPLPHLGVYAVGWAKRGPSGVIGTNKDCARQTVAALLDDYVAGRLCTPAEGPGYLHRILAGKAVIGPDGWKAIDERERALGRAESRPRVKLVSIPQMRVVAATGAGDPAPE